MYSFGQKILDIVVAEYSLSLGNIDSWLTYPPKPELGDFALGCFGIAKELGRNPAEIAKELSAALSREEMTFKDVYSMGPYINFKLNDNYFITSLTDFSIEEKNKREETVIVDYIGANLGKPLHVGHLCTPSQGQTIVNIFRYLGYTVISDSHFGDWGLFGKLVAAYKLYGNIDDLRKDPIEYLLQLYIKITAEAEKNPELEEIARKEFRKLSDGDTENITLWKEFVSYSLDAMNKILELINVKPDYDIGESFYEGIGLPKMQDYPDLKHTMNDIVDELLQKNIATKNEDGSIGVVFPEESKITSCVLQKRDSTNLYLTSDLACIKYRIDNWKPSKIIYFVDVRQQLHLKQAFTIAKMAWQETNNIELFHAYNGFIKLKDGAMSTRKGTIIRLKDLVNEGLEKTQSILTLKGRQLSQDDIRKITVGAIKYSYLSQDREKDVVFDWEKALSFEGNSGPYIQYAYVRARKIIENGKPEIGNPKFETIELSTNDKSLIKKLLEFDSKIEETLSKYKPHILAQYSYELASEFNSFYVYTPKILEEKNEELKNFRMLIIQKFSETLNKSFELLGMEMPSEM